MRNKKIPSSETKKRVSLEGKKCSLTGGNFFSLKFPLVRQKRRKVEEIPPSETTQRKQQILITGVSLFPLTTRWRQSRAHFCNYASSLTHSSHPPFLPFWPPLHPFLTWLQPYFLPSLLSFVAPFPPFFIPSFLLDRWPMLSHLIWGTHLLIPSCHFSLYVFLPSFFPFNPTLLPFSVSTLKCRCTVANKGEFPVVCPSI